MTFPFIAASAPSIPTNRNKIFFFAVVTIFQMLQAHLWFSFLGKPITVLANPLSKPSSTFLEVALSMTKWNCSFNYLLVQLMCISK